MPAAAGDPVPCAPAPTADGGQELPATSIADDPKDASELVARLEALSRTVPKLAWDVIHEWNDGMTSMDDGYKLQGRFNRKEGIRIRAIGMGRAHGLAHGAQDGPNLYQLVYAPAHVSAAFTVLSFEAGSNSLSFPHMLLRAGKGDPDHAAVDPRLLPGPAPVLYRFDEPLIQYQLGPALMFGHEPGLKLEGPVKVADVMCWVLTSRRVADEAVRRGPEGWYPAREVVKRFFVRPDGVLAGMECAVKTEAGTDVVRTEVTRYQTFLKLELPEHVRVTQQEGTGPTRMGRRRVVLDPFDT